MCWVMPPASPAATSVSRIASSSDVLPWSTWPMIVTTGARGSSSSSLSSNSGSAPASSAAWTISISLSNSSARIWIVSSDSVWVTIAISPRLISFLISSGTGSARYSATSLTVEPELTLMTSAFSEAASCGAGSVNVPRRRRPPRRGGRRCGPIGPPPGPPGPPGPRRAACESITTRRTPPVEPGARSPCSEERVGRWRRGSPPSWRPPALPSAFGCFLASSRSCAAFCCCWRSTSR